MKLKDIKWYRIKQSIDITKILGRCYYFNSALVWWLIDIVTLILIGFKWSLLIVVIPLGLITIITTINWIRTLVYATFCKNTPRIMEEKLLDRSNALQGVPGSGKSSSMNEIGFILAKSQWKKLQHEYWEICNIPYDNLSQNLKEKYNEVIKAYNFYNSHLETHIPCLHSIYSIFCNGRQSYELTKDQLLQKEALPYRSVWVADEISNLFPNSNNGTTKEENSKLSEMSRWIRHFTDSYAIFADIRFGDAFLSIRSGCGCLLTLTEKQKWILKPRFLIGLRATLMSLVDWDYLMIDMCKYGSGSYYQAKHRLNRTSRNLAKFIIWLNKLISCVGYRKYTYKKEGNREQGDKQSAEVTRNGHYYLKSCLSIVYNDRAFKNLYEVKDKPFIEPNTSQYYLSKEDLKRRLGRKD